MTNAHQDRSEAELKDELRSLTSLLRCRGLYGAERRDVMQLVAELKKELARREYVGTCDGCGSVARLTEVSPTGSPDDYQELCDHCLAQRVRCEACNKLFFRESCDEVICEACCVAEFRAMDGMDD